MNPLICPAVLAADEQEYKLEMEKVASFARRIQIDLTDGQFAPHSTITPEQAWWTIGMSADVHLMFKDPLAAAELLLRHSPRLVIVHAEADFNFKKLQKLCRGADARLGVALLPETTVEAAWPKLEHADHALVFSGALGQYGGHADLSLLDKVASIRQALPEIEIGWDGGINDQNVAALASGGVDVLNVGGFIQHSPDPARTFEALQRIADETGTT